MTSIANSQAAQARRQQRTRHAGAHARASSPTTMNTPTESEPP